MTSTPAPAAPSAPRFEGKCPHNTTRSRAWPFAVIRPGRKHQGGAS